MKSKGEERFHVVKRPLTGAGPSARSVVLTACEEEGDDMALTKAEAAWNGRSGESVAQAFAPDGVRIE